MNKGRVPDKTKLVADVFFEVLSWTAHDLVPLGVTPTVSFALIVSPLSTRPDHGEIFSIKSGSGEVLELVSYNPSNSKDASWVRTIQVVDNYDDYKASARRLVHEFGFDPPDYLDEDEYFWEDSFEEVWSTAGADESGSVTYRKAALNASETLKTMYPQFNHVMWVIDDNGARPVATGLQVASTPWQGVRAFVREVGIMDIMSTIPSEGIRMRQIHFRSPEGAEATIVGAIEDVLAQLLRDLEKGGPQDRA
jgi:hypothetical protein